MTVTANLPEIYLPSRYSYIGVFLTMACPYRCSYCINQFDYPRSSHPTMPAADWINALHRLTNLGRPDGQIPITLQGGEPSVHSGFYDIINQLSPNIKIDILTNLSFDVTKMIARVDPQRLKRQAPYASIRVSYHPEQTSLDELLQKVHRLQNAGFSIGVYGVMHPAQSDIILAASHRARNEGIDFRTKEFLGNYKGKLYGQYKYPRACTSSVEQFSDQINFPDNPAVQCRTTELLIGPDGSVYRCHHDLYNAYQPIGHILDADFQIKDEFLSCSNYGHCNPCDIKVKTNRLQQFGHTSVEIKFSEQANPQNPISPFPEPVKNIPSVIVG